MNVPTGSLLLSACCLFLARGAAAQEAPGFATLYQASLEAMGASRVERIEFTGSGWEACLGQPWRVEEGWARWEVTDYRRVIDYPAMASLQTAQRRAGLDPGKLGGCGAQPGAAPQAQQSSISTGSSWEQQLPLWLTPPGFLYLARQHEPAVAREGDGYRLSFSLEREGVTYTLTGVLDAQYLPTHIETRVDNPVFGDMPVEAEFSDYRDFNGLRFPAMFVHSQGGHPVLSLAIENVTANTRASAEPPPRTGGGFGGRGQNAEQPPPYTEIAPGVFVINGAYQAVAVEFNDFLVVIDGMQSDARTREVIARSKAAIPGKPIRYVVNTHAHFDHASGLREFVAEGSTILTHESNVAFYREALSTPRTLNPDATAIIGLPLRIEGVGERHVISDGSQVLELYKLQGSLHADDMLIAWLPDSGTVVESDLLQPWINPVFGGGREGPHPFLQHLANELERLGLDYEQFVPVHRPTPAPVMPGSALREAVE